LERGRGKKDRKETKEEEKRIEEEGRGEERRL
jgi:hypothetical protein